MARRKGSGRGKTTVNSRKSTLENTRERLKDDSGVTKKTSPKQQEQNLNKSNMDAATTTTSTAKHYNKTTKLQNNHHRTTERRGTYRTHSSETLANLNAGENVKVQKQTAKQAKAAAQRAVAVGASCTAATHESDGGNNSNKATVSGGAKDPLAIGGNDSVTLAAVQSIASGGKAARAKEAREQKTIAKTEAGGGGTVVAVNAATENAINSTSAISGGNNNYNNNNNRKHSDNSNSSFNKNNITISEKNEMARKSDKPQQQQEAANNKNHYNNSGDIKITTAANNKAQELNTIITNNASATSTTTTNTEPPNTWNNSRYLHKKFKRLASTTDVDSIVTDSQNVNNVGSSASSECGSEAPQMRTTSLSSSASTSSISPPPASTPTPTAILPSIATQVRTAEARTTVNPTSAPISEMTNVGLMNGHTYLSPKSTAIASTNEHSSNSINSVKYSSVPINSNNIEYNKNENNNNDRPVIISNQQHLDVEQLPQTMLHFMETQSQSQQQNNTNNAINAGANTGRYVCPYCNLNCTKPSVLQKHIRAHTNERPYPCDICGIAFKTNSNYYKHCRSRSHAARKRGIEVPISAEDGIFGGSDQEGDPELSNSSSDVISRTASPLNEGTNVSPTTITNSSTSAVTIIPQQLQQLQQLQQQQQKQVQLQQQQQQFNQAIHQQQQPTVAAQSPHNVHPSTPSPSSVSSIKSAYLQQPAQKLPLGSPAAGTLPPPATTSISNATTTTPTGASTPSTPKQVGNAEHKPYKPKFHNAALYATTKEAAAAVAAAGLLQQSPLQHTHRTQQQQQITQEPEQQHQHNISAVDRHLTIPTQVQTHTPPPVVAPSSTTHQYHAHHPSHHPSLSPSTQVKLNNHINTHQLQMQMQQQQHQLQQQHQPPPLPQPLHVLPPLGAGLPLHHVAAAMSPKSAAQRPDLVNAAAIAAANMGYLAAPRMIYPPSAMDFPPDHALHLMMPESRQKLQYQVQQYKWLEHELQQQLHKLGHQQLQQQQQPTQLSQQQIHASHTQQTPSAPATTILKPTATIPGIHHQRTIVTQHTNAATSSTTSQQIMSQTPSQQTPIQYVVNPTATGGQQQLKAAVSNNGSGIAMSSSVTNNTTASISTGILHSNISNAAAASSANKVADLVQEHITKLISQNEAIVENKAVILQKKYPKGLNRSRSFNNSGNGSTTTATTSINNAGASGGSNTSLVVNTSTSGGGSESGTNARLAQAIVQKQQHQLQQQQQYQQQFHQQLLAGTQMPPPPGHQQLQQQQHFQQQQHLAQVRLEEQHHQQQQQQFHQQHQQHNLQANGISKHLNTSTKIATSTPQQQSQVLHQPQTQQPLQLQQAPQTIYQQHSAAHTGLPPQKIQRLTPSPSSTASTGSPVPYKDIMMNTLPVANTSKNAASSNSLPLNLSAKPKIRQEEPPATVPIDTTPPISTTTAVITPRKRHSIENQIGNSSNDGSTNSAIIIATSTVPNANNAKQQPNVSIIKNLLLNARGLAVPTGEGEDAVYNCPLCACTFRTAEDLQLHNSTYCQGASSAPISPVSSPSYRYFRSNSISLNLPELKNSIFRSRDPLPLAKLAWYQLRTKPSSLVLSRLSASQAGSSKSTTTTTTSATSTAPTSSTSSNSIASCIASPSTATTPSTVTAPPAALTLPDPNIVRLVDAPLPSPGPLLGKTPLVDFGNTSDGRKSADVIITKMHDDRQFDGGHISKRAKLTLDASESFVLGPAPNVSCGGAGGQMPTTSGKRLNINTISGGDMQMLSNNNTATNELGSANKKEDRMRRFNSSGGCIIPISECSDVDKSPKMIRTPLLSGGSFQEVSPKAKDKENKSCTVTAAAPLSFNHSTHFNSKLGLPPGLSLSSSSGPQHFQFPINPITAFNPLTLPPLQSGVGMVGEKIIPHVPGMPGPNSLTPQLPPPQNLQLSQQQTQMPQSSGGGVGRSMSPSRKRTQSPMLIKNSASPNSMALPTHETLKSLSAFGGVQNVPSEFDRIPPPTGIRTARNWNQNITAGSASVKPLPGVGNNNLDVPKKSFNFTRMADNISPRKGSANINVPRSSPPENEVRHFNFDHLTKDGESVMTRISVSSALTPLHVDINSSSAGVFTNCSISDSTEVEQRKTKFLRPTSLPLKPGTFTPKRHHGITPTANTLPLISPETPRPSKSCVQLYLNGHAYTYLGLKCSTKMFYCTVNCPQPSYVAGAQKLSMYSVWQVCAENNPHPLGFKPKVVMSLYDSRQKTSTNTMAGTDKAPYSLVVSQQTVMTPFENNQGQFQHHQLKQISPNTNNPIEVEEQVKKSSAGSTSSGGSGSSGGTRDDGGLNKKDTAAGQMLVGGYESHEDYTYIRGRGRGRYVCSECGIRCKKPSMLKKHIRTHTDVRPYTCKHCNFSFKTKGNLTKHMQSKTHYKKCLELGINPGPMPADGVFLEPEPEFDQQSTNSAGGRTSSIPGESDSDDYSDNESESSDTDESKSRLLEHEAARCLLSLSMTPPIGQSISPHPRTSEPYPYQQNDRIDLSTMSFGVHTGVPATSTTTISSSASNITHPTNIKRVISFSSPKPPFDYQKQEQYYSNPEESKPKLVNNASAASYESAPIDLTKPRTVTTNPTPSPVSTVNSMVRSSIGNEDYNTNTAVPLNGPPVQTQAQIRDVIFGGSNNESGFLKTLISVSDKVRNSTEMLENYKNGDELSQAYQYHKAFQYHKIKQIQMNRSFPDAINVSAFNQNLATTPIVCSTVSVAGVELSTANTTTTPSGSTGMRISEATVSTTSALICTTDMKDKIPAPQVGHSQELTNLNSEVASESIKMDLQVPTIKISADVANENSAVRTNVPNKPNNNNPGIPHASDSKQALSSISNLPYKSSDEGEDSECISDQEQSSTNHIPQGKQNVGLTPATVNSTTAEQHNAKLPAVVAQPGTTDFTGVLSTPGRTMVVGEEGLKTSATNKEIQPVYPRVRMSPDGRPVCKVCAKTFQTQGQLSLHMNIHYMERKFRCEPCGVSFRTQGHLQKHERADSHKNKVMMTSTFGVPTTSNPRPFECTDCKIAFRIHGHLAKHLRSKTHVQKLECLQKLPFGTYAEIERAGISLTEIDTSDCENSLISLKTLAQKLIEKDPNKLGSYTTPSGMSGVIGSHAVSGGVGDGVSGSGGLVGLIVDTTNTNTNHSAIVSQDSDSEDIFSAATMAAASAIASLDKDSAANTPKRANSTSDDEAIANGLHNNLKRRFQGNFSNAEESDNPNDNGGGGAGDVAGGTSGRIDCAVSLGKRPRVSSLSSAGNVSTAAAIGSPASITSSNTSSIN